MHRCQSAAGGAVDKVAREVRDGPEENLFPPINTKYWPIK